jgi:hypothetical protein
VEVVGVGTLLRGRKIGEVLEKVSIEVEGVNHIEVDIANGVNHNE